MLKIYVCGPTVYDHVHIGNMRPILFFDLFLRSVRYKKIEYKFVHNITDIDDKIIKKALSESESENQISQFFTNAYLDLLKKANVDTISKIEKVTENLDLINNYLCWLQEKNATYSVGTDLLFSVGKYKEYYGKVSNQKLDEMQFEEMTIQKKFLADFSLWKDTSVGVKFNSNFGEGRPGWHTECAALIYKHFGEFGVDIHGGGIDLVFPHHENENIQHYSLTNNQIANEWMRTGQINFDGEKMSKSKGNIIKANDFFDKYGVDTYRMILLNSSISGPINLNEEVIQNAQLINYKIRKITFDWYCNSGEFENETEDTQAKIIDQIYEKNFSNFMYEVNTLIKDFNKTKDYKKAKMLLNIFKILGFSETFDGFETYKQTYKEWRDLVLKRDFEKSDQIRKILLEKKLI